LPGRWSDPFGRARRFNNLDDFGADTGGAGEGPVKFNFDLTLPVALSRNKFQLVETNLHVSIEIYRSFQKVLG
jgi:hypothetical protein